MAVVYNESKTDCTVIVGGEQFEGVAHLIEVVYSERIRFWNAVFQVPMEIADAMGRHGNLPIFVKLADGRSAGLNVTHGNMEGGYFELAGVGNPN